MINVQLMWCLYVWSNYAAVLSCDEFTLKVGIRLWRTRLLFVFLLVSLV